MVITKVTIQDFHKLIEQFRKWILCKIWNARYRFKCRLIPVYSKLSTDGAKGFTYLSNDAPYHFYDEVISYLNAKIPVKDWSLWMNSQITRPYTTRFQCTRTKVYFLLNPFRKRKLWITKRLGLIDHRCEVALSYLPRTKLPMLHF